MGVSGSKHVLTLKGLKDERKGHEGEHEAHTKEHEEHKAVVDERHGKLKGIIEQRRKEWAAQDAGWRELAEKIKAEEDAIAAKEKMLLGKIVEMLQGKMYSACFRAWRDHSQRLTRQRLREGYRTQVEELQYDNSELEVQAREITQQLTFATDADLKAKATALIARLGHRDRAMYFAMWRTFARESIYTRRDKVALEWKAKLEKATQQRDRMLWRLEHARQTQGSDSSTIVELGEKDVRRDEALPALGEGLLVALHAVDTTANQFPNYARRTELMEQRSHLQEACATFGTEVRPVTGSSFALFFWCCLCSFFHSQVGCLSGSAGLACA